MSRPDFETPERFTPIDGLVRSSLIPMVLLGIPLVVLSWLVFGLVMVALKAPAPQWLGLVLAVAFTALMVWVRLKMARKNVDSIELILAPEGIRYTADGATRSVAWQDLREVRRITPMVGVDARKAARGIGYDSAGAKGGQAMVNALGAAGAALTAGTGVVGLGQIEIHGGALARETFRQNEGRNGRDPQTGAPYQPIPFSQFSDRWDQHRIGAWLAHFRPDLAAQASALMAKDS